MSWRTEVMKTRLFIPVTFTHSKFVSWMSEINSCSTSLTGPSEGPPRPVLSDFQVRFGCWGSRLPQLCALFLSIVRDQRSRLEHVWKIPVQQGGSSKGTLGAPALPQDADMDPLFLQQCCQDPTSWRGPAHSTWEAGREDAKIINAFFFFPLEMYAWKATWVKSSYNVGLPYWSSG